MKSILYVSLLSTILCINPLIAVSSEYAPGNEIETTQGSSKTITIDEGTQEAPVVVTRSVTFMKPGTTIILGDPQDFNNQPESEITGSQGQADTISAQPDMPAEIEMPEEVAVPEESMPEGVEQQVTLPEQEISVVEENIVEPLQIETQEPAIKEIVQVPSLEEPMIEPAIEIKPEVQVIEQSGTRRVRKVRHNEGASCDYCREKKSEVACHCGPHCFCARNECKCIKEGCRCGQNSLQVIELKVGEIHTIELTSGLKGDWVVVGRRMPRWLHAKIKTSIAPSGEEPSVLEIRGNKSGKAKIIVHNIDKQTNQLYAVRRYEIRVAREAR